MEIYIHIGKAKTGTTAIQKFLADNYEALLKKGVLYPKTGMDEFTHWPVTPLFDSNADLKSQAQYLTGLKSEIADSKAHTVILSSENFYNMTGLRAFRDAFDDSVSIKLILYLRKPDELMNSLVNQNLKARTGKADAGDVLEELINKKALEDWQQVQDHQAVFGEDNILVGLYTDEFKVKPAGLLRDFLKTTGVESSGLYIQPALVNVSLAKEAVEFSQATKEFTKHDPPLAEHLAGLLMEYSLTAKAPATILTPRQCKRVRELAKEDYFHIGRRYLAEPDLQIVRDWFKEDEVEPQPASPATIQDPLYYILLEQIKRNNRQARRIEQLEASVRWTLPHIFRYLVKKIFGK